MGKFDGILICTDLDGTLFSSDKTISEENRCAIEYFQSEGGYFTFVTGRMPFFVSDVTDRVKPNAPFGCVNGAGLYDFYKNEYVWTCVMDDKVIELLSIIDREIPTAAFQVNSFNKVYFCKENGVMKEFRRLTGLENIVCDYKNPPEPIAKIVFGCETQDEMIKIKAVKDTHPIGAGFDYVQSEEYLCEYLTKGINKGTSIAKLCEYLGVDKRKTVAIGDYNNDIPMFEAAQVGIAVSNACEDALNAADFVTVSNDENAIARVIYDIEDGKYDL